MKNTCLDLPKQLKWSSNGDFFPLKGKYWSRSKERGWKNINDTFERTYLYVGIYMYTLTKIGYLWDLLCTLSGTFISQRLFCWPLKCFYVTKKKKNEENYAWWPFLYITKEKPITRFSNPYATYILLNGGI